MAKPQSLTSIGQSPELERRARMLKYTVAMTVRVICLVVGVAVGQGPIMWVAFAGAILLPYFAVVIANASTSGQSDSSPKAVAPTLVISADSFTSSTKVSE
ncbi:MAG: hypothetical protein RL716_193 [Actinomycetota bacterium]|jgi:hypothetical protein|uniref:DUF3099 domain-containing protein n=1 Tax=Rhodoluna sp. TaxID=1969481 RepID=UPI0025E83CE2|nr:DUF3099 domain-containing protein [Rhodoluna sp.]